MEENLLSEGLSEAGIYSYCALTAMSLQKMFPDDVDKTFRDQTIRDFTRYLNTELKPVMVALVSGEITGEFEPYLNILREEKLLIKMKDLAQLVKDLVKFAVETGVYDARMRVCIRFVAVKLKVSREVIEDFERTLVQCISMERVEQSAKEDEQTAKRHRTKKIKRYLMIGIATVGGGAVLGLTGGLAAPLVAAGAGAVIGGAGAAALGSAAGVAVISSVMGVAGAGLTGYKMKKRLGEIEEFAFSELTKGHELHITIAISGWLSDDEPNGQVIHPWRSLRNSREQYVLRYESKYLVELGTAVNYLYSFAVSMAAQEALKYTILSGLIAAIAWPAALISAAGVIDNPWGVCQRRCAQVGRHLADVLLQRQQGNRPVTLIGFSLGARVIYYCLKELSTRDNCEGIIENAILLGAPVPANANDWSTFKRLVAGKIVNGYCRDDWLLKFVYRTSSANMKIAGLQPIEWKDRRMRNCDLSDIVTGHTDYYSNLNAILEKIGVPIGDNEHNIAIDECRKRRTNRAFSESNLLALRENEMFNKLRLSIESDLGNSRAFTSASSARRDTLRLTTTSTSGFASDASIDDFEDIPKDPTDTKQNSFAARRMSH